MRIRKLTAGSLQICLKVSAHESSWREGTYRSCGRLGQKEWPERLESHGNLRGYQFAGKRTLRLLRLCRSRFVHRELHGEKTRSDRCRSGRVYRSKEFVPSCVAEWPLRASATVPGFNAISSPTSLAKTY